MTSKKSLLFIISLVVLISLGFFVIGESYFTRSNSGLFGFFNLTQNMSSGINLTGTNLVGDFVSGVFFNETLANWNVILGTSGTSVTQNITVQGRIASNYNISDIGLVGFWAFNNEAGIGDSATKFVDRLSKNNMSCLTSGVLGMNQCPSSNLTGVVGRSLKYDYANDFISVPSSNDLNITQNITISAWIRKEQSNGIEGIVTKGTYSLKIDSQNNPYFEISDGSEVIGNLSIPTTGMGQGMAVFNRQLYVAMDDVYRYDGDFKATNTWTDTDIAISNAGLTVFNNTIFAFDCCSAGKYYNGVTSASAGDPTDFYQGFALYNNSLYHIGYNSGTISKYNGGTSWSSVGQTGATGSYSAVWNGTLYVGEEDTYNGGRVFKYNGGTSWSSIGQVGASVTRTQSMAAYNGSLYAGSYGSVGVYQYLGGTSWSKIGTMSGGTLVYRLSVYNGKLYSATGAGGTNLSRYNGGTSWTQVQAGIGDRIYHLGVYNGRLIVLTDGNLVRTIGNGSSAFSNETMNLNKWTHVVGTYDGSEVVTYVDGVRKGNRTWLGGTIGANDLPLLIGSSYGTSMYNLGNSQEVFSGQIDEVRIYNRSLSSSEVQNLYNLGSYHIADWSDWSSENSVTSGVAKSFSALGMKKFFQFKTNLRTSSSSASPILVNQTVQALPDQPPVISAVYPLNGYYSYNITALNYTVSDDVGLSACWYYN